MSYLTFSDYTSLHAQGAVTSDQFTKLLPFASDTLDQVTRYFYQRFDLATDAATFRADQFKRALCYEIDYMNDHNVLTQSDVDDNSKITQQNVGGISISQSSPTNSGGNSNASSIISTDVLRMLEPTGLLYAGVS